MELPIQRAIKFILRHTCRIKGYAVLTIEEAQTACRIAAEESTQAMCKNCKLKNHDGDVHKDTQEDHS